MGAEKRGGLNVVQTNQRKQYQTHSSNVMEENNSDENRLRRAGLSAAAAPRAWFLPIKKRVLQL